MQELPPLKTLPVFLSLCQNLNFSRAAQELCLTHSAVSHSLKQLENFLGVRLFDRNTHSVSLTEEGKMYKKKIIKALNLIKTATTEVRQEKYTIKVNILKSLVSSYIIPKLSSFTDLFPTINMQISTKTDSVDRLFNSGIDVAIVYEKKESLQDYITRLFCEDSLVLVGSPEWVKGKEGSDITTYLEKVTVLAVYDDMRKNDWHQWCEATGIIFPYQARMINFQNTPQAIGAAISGLGIIVTHYPFVEKALKEKQLVQLHQAKVATERQFFIVTKPEKIGFPAVRYCINWLSERKTNAGKIQV